QRLQLDLRALPGRTLVDECGLRNLEPQVARGQIRLLERRPDDRADPGPRELAPREVDPGDEVLGQEALAPPASGLRTGFAQDVLAEREDEAGRLGHGDEAV